MFEKINNIRSVIDRYIGMRTILIILSIFYLIYTISFFIFNSREAAVYITHTTCMIILYLWNNKNEERRKNTVMWETRINAIEMLLKLISSDILFFRYESAEKSLDIVHVLLIDYESKLTDGDDKKVLAVIIHTVNQINVRGVDAQNDIANLKKLIRMIVIKLT